MHVCNVLFVNPVFRPRYMGGECDADRERCCAGEPSAARLARLLAVRCEAGKRAADLEDNNKQAASVTAVTVDDAAVDVMYVKQQLCHLK
jgi:hypothetical protein